MENEGRRAVFGRRKGKRLRGGHSRLVETLLPALRIDPARMPADPAGLFDVPVDDVWLEIGFGGGEHLAALAREHPRVGFIGCEPFVNGMAKMLAEIERDGLRNVRLFDGDAALLLPRLPHGRFGRAYLLYPDPWPKRRQNKRRFVSPERLAQLAAALRPGAEFRFASDIDDYVAWTLARIAAGDTFDWLAERADDWRVVWPGWVRTRYEAKALREGRLPSYLRFRRR